MAIVNRDSSLFSSLQSKTAIIISSSNSIGAETVKLFNSYGANIVIADLEYSRPAAEAVIASLSSRVIFIPADILNWSNMVFLFKETKKKFGSIEVVVANAGIMESKSCFDFEEDENGDLEEPKESYRMIDVNLKGTMNSEKSHAFSPEANSD